MKLWKLARDSFKEGFRRAYFEHPLTKKIQADAWRQGYVAGGSRAMRRMSDEPNVEHARNPHEA